MIVDGDPVAKFVSERVGKAFCPPFYAIGWERGGEIVGGVILNCYETTDVHVSVAGSGWTKGFLQALGEYVFGTLGVQRVTIITEQPKVVGFALRLGGQIEGLLRSHFGRGRDAHVIGVLRDEFLYCKVATKAAPLN